MSEQERRFGKIITSVASGQTGLGVVNTQLVGNGVWPYQGITKVRLGTDFDIILSCNATPTRRFHHLHICDRNRCRAPGVV